MCTSNTELPASRIRDGSTTDLIPATPEGANATTMNGELLYGMHESLAYFEFCQLRERNSNLWIADQTLMVKTNHHFAKPLPML